MTIVPLDVRVLDKDGKPVTGLTEADFTILEDNVPQKIAHFSAQIFEAGAAQPALRARPDASVFDDSPQTERVFLIALGTAALGNPAKHPETLNALLRFVRERLLPQDQVALIGNGRATDFTADHEKVAEMLERLRKPGPGSVLPLNRQGLYPEDATSMFVQPSPLEPPTPLKNELGLQEYAKASPPPRGDLDMLLYGIRYMRFMTGAKHLIYVNGLFSWIGWQWEQVTRLIQAATDARVSLDTIQTGGRISDVELPTSRDPDPTARQLLAPGPPTPGVEVTVNPGRVEHAREGGPGNGGTGVAGGGTPMGGNALAGWHGLYDLHYVASATGGQSSMLDLGEKSLARIDAATRAHYLIGYYPSNSNWDGRYRKVRVTVNRPDVTVLFRHGYTADQKIETFDKKAFITDSRLAAAGYALTDARDIAVKMTPVFTKSTTGKGGEVVANVVIDASRVSFTVNDIQRHEAHLDVAVYCGDAGQNVVGQLRQVIDLNLTDATYDRFTQNGIPHEMRVPVTGRPRFVKVVVLDYEANLTGSAVVTMK